MARPDARPDQGALVRALALSVLAASVPIAGVFLFPDELQDYEALTWLLLLVPAFLWAYQRGWRGVATALAFGMATLSTTYAFAEIADRRIPDLLLAIVVIYVAVSLGIGLFGDRLGRARYDAAAESLALNDPLTGLPNRRHAEMHLDVQFAAARRGIPLAVILFDIDRLSDYNRMNGEAAGDGVLRGFSSLLRQHTRQMDLAARYGPEEFLAVLSGGTEEGALIFAARLQERLRAATQTVALPTVSAGIASYHPGMSSARELVEAAEHALLVAKRHGRDRVRIHGRELGEMPEAGDPGVSQCDDHPDSVTTGAVARTAGGAARGAGRNVMIMTADSGVRSAITSALTGRGFHVAELGARPGTAAPVNREFDVAFIDLDRQGSPSEEMIREIRRRWPATRIVGILPTARGTVQPDMLRVRVDAHYAPATDDAALLQQVTELLGERDALRIAELRHRQLANEMRTLDREAREALRESEQHLQRARQMDAIGRVAATVAHDFNNLLTAIQGHADLLIEDLPDASRIRNDVLEIREAAHRATSLTRQLLAFSSRQVLQPRTIDLNQVVRDMEDRLRDVAGDRTLATSLDDEAHWVRADPIQIEEVLVNLVANARDALTAGGVVTIETGRRGIDDVEAASTGLEPSEFVVLSVRDSGAGMTDAVAAQAFEPFFTTKRAGGRAGLGLATVYGIVRQSSGHVALRSEPGAGTVVTVMLPATQPIPAAVPARAARDDATQQQGGDTILLVEDEKAVRELTLRILEGDGYEVLVAANGREALELMAREPRRIDLLLTDVMMPEINGPELAERVREQREDIRIVFMSGFTEEAVFRNGILAHGSAFVAKPFSPALLLRRIRAMLDSEAA